MLRQPSIAQATLSDGVAALQAVHVRVRGRIEELGATRGRLARDVRSELEELERAHTDQVPRPTVLMPGDKAQG